MTCATKPSVPKYLAERGIADVEAAGISAECRHDRAFTVARETSPLQRPAARGDPRLGVQMSGNFAGGSRRLVAERDFVHGDFARRHRRPYRPAIPDHGSRKSISIRAALAAPRARRGPDADNRPCASRSWKLVAKRDHAAGIVTRNRRAKAAECRDRVIGRQQLAAQRIAGALFKVEIRDHQQALVSQYSAPDRSAHRVTLPTRTVACGDSSEMTAMALKSRSEISRGRAVVDHDRRFREGVAGFHLKMALQCGVRWFTVASPHE